jgi:hypothetical protein
VTLYTGGLSRWIWTLISKDRATQGRQKIAPCFNALEEGRRTGGGSEQPPFLPGGKFCRLRYAKAAHPDCLAGIRPILKSGFSAASEQANGLPEALPGSLVIAR